MTTSRWISHFAAQTRNRPWPVTSRSRPQAAGWSRLRRTAERGTGFGFGLHGCQHQMGGQRLDRPGRSAALQVGGRGLGPDAPGRQPVQRQQGRQRGPVGACDPARQPPVHATRRVQPADPGP